jgi:hypothetical protein
MWKRLGLALVALPLAGCLWLPVGAGARPRLGLEAVERVPAGAPGGGFLPAAEPGERGWLFADSLIGFRTRARPASVRFRVWNRGREPVRILWDTAATAPPADGCPESAAGWMLRPDGTAGGPDTLAPGESWESDALPAARPAAPAGETWREAGLACLVFDPAEPRMALRLGVERAGVRYDYTFWYRLMEPPREDRPGEPGRGGGDAPHRRRRAAGKR